VEGEVAGERNAEGRYPNEVAGWRVLFDEDPGEILSVTSRSIRVISPPSVAGKRTVIVAIVNGPRRGTTTVPVYAKNPGIYVLADGAVAVNEDGSPNSEAAPESAGKIVTFRATGLGGANAEVRIAGLPAEVVSVGPVEGQPEVVYAVSVRVPEGAGTGRVLLEIAGALATTTERYIHLR
jgi:uncharacterized protein (TIGR03437 family)